MDKGQGGLIKTIFLSATAVVFSYLINFFLTPYITDKLGAEAYGFVSLARNTVGYASIITVAFTAFMVRYISLEFHKKHYIEANKYYASSIASTVVLTAIIIVCMIIITVFIQQLFNIPERLLGDVRILFILVFLGFCFETITVPFSAGYYIKDRLDSYQILKALSYVLEAMVLLILYRFFSSKVWFVGLSLLLAAALIMIGSIVLSKKLVPELKYKKENVSIKIGLDMLQNGIWQSVNSLGTTLNSGLDLWISNLLLNATQMGQISITKIIVGMFTVLYSTVSQAFQPRMLKAYSSENKKIFLKELIFAMRFCGAFATCAFAGFIAIGHAYYKLWLPNQDFDLLYRLTVVSVISSLTDGIIYPAYYVNTLTTKKKIPCFVTIATGVLNVVGMFLLIRYTDMGIYSIVVTTTILMLFTNGVFNPIYCSVTLKLPWYTLFPLMIRHILVSLFITVIFVIVSKAVNPTSWIMLIGTAVILIFIGLPIYVILMSNKEEREKIINKFLVK